MKLLKFLKISGKVENNLMVWSFGFFLFSHISQKYWQASVNHSQTMQWRSGVHEKLLCSIPSLFPPEKKTVKWIQCLAGSNTFWCWKAVLDHCRGEEGREEQESSLQLAAKKPRTICPQAKKAKRREPKPERRRFQLAAPRSGLPKDGHKVLGQAGERRVVVKSLLLAQAHAKRGSLDHFLTSLPVPWHVDFYRYMGSCRHN